MERMSRVGVRPSAGEGGDVVKWWLLLLLLCSVNYHTPFFSVSSKPVLGEGRNWCKHKLEIRIYIL